jgi:hypothetical protein
MGVPGGDDTAGGGTGEVGLGAVVVGVLGVKTPAASLPEGALRLTMVWLVLVALETVGEAGFTSASLSEDDAASERVFSRFHIRWTLGSEDARDAGWRRCGRAVSVKMRDKTGADGGVGKATVGSQELVLCACNVVVQL